MAPAERKSSARREEPVIRVAPVPAAGGSGLLDYRVPEGHGAVVPGCRVMVPLGSRHRMAVVTEVSPACPHPRLKPITAVLDSVPVIRGPLFALVRWMATYYMASLGEAIATALPGALRIEVERLVSAVVPAGEARGIEGEVLDALAGGPSTLAVLRKRFGEAGARAVTRLQRKGLVSVEERLRREQAVARRVTWFEATRKMPSAAGLLDRRPAVRELYSYLAGHPMRIVEAGELRGSFANAAAKLRLLEAAGLVLRRVEEVYRPVLPPVVGPDRPVILNPHQRAAVDAIVEAQRRGFAPFLLWGVTGSGKTEVYLHAIAAALQAGKSALVLVPEISLTHQVVDRVRARFGDRVAVLHSQLSAGERWDEWRRIARGEAHIVVGARSAVFAPLRRLGIIIVDEEHDTAYKQMDGVRYHGRDVSVMRAKLAACPVVLGSATPSMESFHNGRTGRYQLLRLPDRVASRPLPEVELVDLRDPRRREPKTLSAALRNALEANLAAGGQSLLFLNRRGFSNFLQCRACGDPVSCPNCSVTLTWHRRWRALRCHYCDYTIPPPEQCAGCGEPALDMWGTGTEQVEGLLREEFPGARVARMDRDTTRRKGSQLAMLEAWARGRLDMMIGTQMVTKGHDIPGVTLVGVLLADAALSFPDFRAAEQTFQLLAQVAGRAGRGARAGRVLVQTLQPNHYSLRAAVRHDFAAFAERELAARRELDYPPYARLLLLRVEGEDSAAVRDLATDVAARLRAVPGRRFGVLGPAPAPLERLRRRYRWQVLLRGRDGPGLRAAATAVRSQVAVRTRGARLRLIADVDPYHML